jgi:hypothetical protein
MGQERLRGVAWGHVGERSIEREGEDTAACRAVLHPDTTAHECDERGRNRQSQSRSAESAGRGAVSLLKGPKDPGLFVEWHAAPRVGDVELKVTAPVTSAQLGDGHDDMSGVRELDGIADEVSDDLPDAQWVAADAIRNVRMDVCNELQSFLVGTECEGTKGIADQIADSERDVFQFEFAGFDLRKKPGCH